MEVVSLQNMYDAVGFWQETASAVWFDVLTKEDSCRFFFWIFKQHKSEKLLIYIF